MDGNSGHRPNRQLPHRKAISEWINPRRHHPYLPIKSSMHPGPSQNRNLLERVGKTARVAGHTSPRRATSSGLRPQDWIYSRVPTQRDDLRRHEGQGQMDGRLFSPAPTKTRRNHGPPPSPLISKQYLLCTKPSSIPPARQGMPDAQRNPTSRVSSTPPKLPIVP